MSSHAAFLQLQGQDTNDVDAIGTAKVDTAKLAPKEVVLMEYVRQLTVDPAKMTDKLTNKMRDAGWSDEQIFEAAFITSLFAFFNRMADAYGLDYLDNRWIPTEVREKRGSIGPTKPPAQKPEEKKPTPSR